jgi:hypothetical protein
MNVKRKQAAVNKYAPMFNQGVTVEELTDLIGKDEKNYTAEEISEISAAIVAGVEEKPAAAKQPVKQPEKAPVKVKEVTGVGYEEWRMEWQSGQVQKLKKLRTNVKITEGEAETLNAGAASPGSVNPIMYFKPE